MTRTLAIVAALAVALLSAPALAQPATTAPTSPGIMAPVECTIAEVQAGTCSSELSGVRIVVTDGADANECGNVGDVGGGSDENVCRWSSTADAWVLSDPPALAGLVAGPGSSSLHEYACFADTTGRLLEECGSGAGDIMLKAYYDAGPEDNVVDFTAALQLNPADCAPGTFATEIDEFGTLTCSPPPDRCGVTAGVGGELTVSCLHGLKEYEGIRSGQFVERMWVDPYDETSLGLGTYEEPFRTRLEILDNCAAFPYMRCTVKGRDRWFSPRTLTVSYSTPGELKVGETVTLSVSPAASAIVIGAEGDSVVLDVTTFPANMAADKWGTSPTAPDPYVGTVITSDATGIAATVTSFQDTLWGLHSVMFEVGDYTVASPSVFTVVGHGLANGDGPYRWVNHPTFPTTSPTVTEGQTLLYICNVAANTFELDTQDDCAGSRIAVTGAGAGESQLYPYWSPSRLLEMNCDPADRLHFCVLLESEFPDSPFGFDAGGFAMDMLRSRIVPGRWSGLATTGTYNSPTGYILGTWQSVAPSDLDYGFFAVQNMIIQNVAMDGFATSNGGLLYVLNGKCRGIRNGESDRAQVGLDEIQTGTPPRYANPGWQAQNSCVQGYANNVDDDTVGGVVYWINGGDSWGYMGNATASGGFGASGSFLNTNEEGVVRVISQGRFSSYVWPTDTNCTGGRPCSNTQIVTPSGELILVGPHKWYYDESAEDGDIFGSGTGDHTGVYRVHFDLNQDCSGWGCSTTQIPKLFSVTPQGPTSDRSLFGNEITFTSSAGPAMLLSVCDFEDGATMRVDLRNFLMEGIDNSNDVGYEGLVADCGGGGTVADAVQGITLNLEGIHDHYDGGDEDKYYFDGATNRVLGTCGTPNTWRGDICAALTAGSLPTTQWRWWEDNSSESGGSGVDGDQFNGDAFYRCDPGEICWMAGAGGTYTVPLRAQKLAETFADETCLLTDVLATADPVCTILQTPKSVGAR